MNISEIAKRAGVSNAAVSRYLNHGYLSEEKRQAIEKVIEATGYRPRLQAQNLRRGRTQIIGVILPKIDSFSISTIMAGIDAVLEANGFQILLADSHNDPKKELEYLDLFGEQLVDGVILIATVLTAQHRAFLKKSKLPVVVVGQQISSNSCVYHDDYRAFYDMTKLVLEKGCRKLGYIGALTDDVAAGQKRSQAYCDAVEEAGLGEQASHIAIADFSIVSGREKAQELLTRCGPLDALICATDSMAVGAMQYLKSQHIRIPDQMLLTGHGASNISDATTPTITTIHFFYEESGSTAARLVLDHLEKPGMPVKEVKLGYTILEKGSTGAPSEEDMPSPSD